MIIGAPYPSFPVGEPIGSLFSVMRLDYRLFAYLY